jgi:SAM-dependent methyltransferase
VALPPDYDDDPERWRTNRRTVAAFTSESDHTVVAARFCDEGLAPILDVGCGDGHLADELPAGSGWVGVDASAAQVASAPRPVVLADAEHLPVRSGSCGAVAALWMLYHLDDPTVAIAEARRVLRPGGLFAASTSRRDDAPELLAHLPPQPASTFDAEEAPAIVASVFGDVDVESWDGPHVRLPDRDGAREYLIGRGLDGEVAAEVAARLDVPLEVTKRGCIVWARR